MATAAQTRRALVLYGSETGNAQDVAEELGRIAERLRFDAQVTELDAIKLVRLGTDVRFRKVRA
jgi:sulfite reductase alpha subunit-like flavoprotein